jgi:predicted PurR-regulated permease PerM
MDTLSARASTRKILGWLLFFVSLIFVLILLPAMLGMLTPIIVSVLLTYLLDPPVTRLESMGVPRVVAILILFVIIGLLLFFLLRLLLPVISHQLAQIVDAARDNRLQTFVAEQRALLASKFPLLQNPQIDERLSQEMTAFLEGFVTRTIAVIAGMFSAITSVVVIPFFVFFLLKDARHMRKVLIAMVPNRYFEMACILLHKTSLQLGRYIRGQLLVAAAVGSLCTLALYLLDVPYFLFIGAIAGLANMIPYFGPIVGGIPAIVVGFIDKGTFEIVVAIVIAFASIQLLENVLISPFVVARSVNLHPLVVILVILAGGSLMGITGMLLAVPVTSIIKVTIEELVWGFKNYQLL